jgi:hypothetical protein
MVEFRPESPTEQRKANPKLSLSGFIASTLIVFGWMVICFFPGYWHAVCDGRIWGTLTDHRQYVSRRWGPEGALPYVDLFHSLFYPAHSAAMKNRPDKLGIHLQTPQLLNLRDFADMTPLHYALVFRRPDAVTMLVKAGADTEIRDPENSSPLWYAINISNDQMIACLLEAGAKLDSPHTGKVTPFHLLIQRQYPNIVALGVNAHLNLGIPDVHGKRPIDYAIAAGNLEMVIELACAGAAYTTSETPPQPIIQLYLALCDKFNNPRRAAEMLAEHSHLIGAMQNTYQRPAEFPIDSRRK